MSQVALAKQQPVKRKKAKVELARIIGFLVLLIVTVAMIMPLGFMLSTSLKTTKEMLVFPPTVIPEHFAWENFKELFVNSEIKFGRQYMNSLIVAIATVIGTVFSSSFVAFGFARYRARGMIIVRARAQYADAALSGNHDSAVSSLYEAWPS